MKRVSTAIMLVGVVMLILALGSDVAVDGMGGRRIINSGLVHDRLVNIILSVALILGGLLLKMFGDRLSVSYLEAIDLLPKSEYSARWATAILSAVCVWMLVVMYFWPTTMVAVGLLAVIAWITFLPQATYTVLRRVWSATLILAVGMATWHTVALVRPWLNDLTFRMIEEGVPLVGTGRLWPLFFVMVGGPLVVSIGGFAFAMFKAKRS